MDPENDGASTMTTKIGMCQWCRDRYVLAPVEGQSMSFGDLHRVCRRTLAQVVRDDLENEAVFHRRIESHAPHMDLVFAGDVGRHGKIVVGGAHDDPRRGRH